MTKLTKATFKKIIKSELARQVEGTNAFLPMKQLCNEYPLYEATIIKANSEVFAELAGV